MLQIYQTIIKELGDIIWEKNKKIQRQEYIIQKQHNKLAKNTVTIELQNALLKKNMRECSIIEKQQSHIDHLINTIKNQRQTIKMLNNRHR